QEYAPSRVGVQGAESWVDLRLAKPGVALGIRPFKPLEGQIGFAARRVHLCDLKGGVSRVLCDQFAQRRVRFGPATCGVMHDRERLDSRPLLRLPQRLGQRILAPALSE